jgi:hypothetical protein
VHDNIIGKRKVKGVEGTEAGPERGFIVYPPALVFEPFARGRFSCRRRERKNRLSELDEQWTLALAEAERRARAGGRTDLVDYLSLRNANDLARNVSIDWLFETFQSCAGEANRQGYSIQITKGDAHRFAVGNATMVGRLLNFNLGVRKLMIEAGWPRMPRDGFVRGGGLASAHIRHFGRRASDEELLLMRERDSAPRWFILERTGERTSLSEERIRHHLNRFLSEK